MKIFDFDPTDYTERYASAGWVHVPSGIDSEFLAYLQDYVARRFREKRVEGVAIGGTKDQALFEFPDDVDFPGELFDAVAAVCGLDRSSMTLSERHIKAYDDDAPTDPPAHKDRFASQVSVGLSIDIPVDSALVLYPHDHRETNPFNISAALRQSLDEEQLPENILPDAHAEVIEDSPGDVVMFPGSAMWHLRRNAARATNLYLKLNDFNSDPLGEDPATPVRRDRTLQLLGAADGRFAELRPVLSRRLDSISRQYTREPGLEVLQAHVWEEAPVGLDPAELELLRELDGRSSVGELMAAGRVTETALRRLAERGALDLLDSPQA
jgi:hypothetical protein